MATTIMAVAAVAGVGLSAYGMATAPGAPTVSAPPPPPNYTQYDEDGNIMSRQVFNAEKNEWITYGPNSEPEKPKEVPNPGAAPDRNTYIKSGSIDFNGSNDGYAPASFDERRYNADLQAWQAQKAAWDQYQKDTSEYQPKYDAWKKDTEDRAANKAKLAELRTQMLDNLNQTPEDRVKAYEDYAKAYSEAIHADVDPRFQKLERGTDEQANATGMFGSRAYVDTKSELAKDKLSADTDIANQATMAREALADTDRKYWASMLDMIDSGARADRVTSAQITKSASDTAAQNYAGTLGYYTARNNQTLADWEAKQAKSASYINAGSNLAGGLLYLYGGSRGGGAAAGGVSAKPTNSGIQRYGQNFSLLG